MPPQASARTGAGVDEDILFRRPSAEDGPAVSALIASCPPLDTNSAYCNLLQCSHFADTCVIAERDGSVVGWISAYRPPSDPESIFVWQVAVARSARGQGLGQRMLAALTSYASVRSAVWLKTTVTPDNDASWAMFKGFARHRRVPFERAVLFDRDRHFGGAHETEWQICIGPMKHNDLPTSSTSERPTS